MIVIGVMLAMMIRMYEWSIGMAMIVFIFHYFELYMVKSGRTISVGYFPNKF